MSEKNVETVANKDVDLSSFTPEQLNAVLNGLSNLTPDQIAALNLTTASPSDRNSNAEWNRVVETRTDRPNGELYIEGHGTNATNGFAEASNLTIRVGGRLYIGGNDSHSTIRETYTGPAEGLSGIRDSGNRQTGNGQYNDSDQYEPSNYNGFGRNLEEYSNNPGSLLPQDNYQGPNTPNTIGKNTGLDDPLSPSAVPNYKSHATTNTKSR